MYDGSRTSQTADTYDFCHLCLTEYFPFTLKEKIIDFFIFRTRTFVMG